MDDLILRSLEGPLSDVEQRRLSEWRAASADHERRYLELVRLSRALETAGRGARDGSPPTVAAILARTRDGGPRRLPTAWWRRPLAAALVAVTAGTAGFEAGRLKRDGSAVAARELTTGPDEASTVRLADGTTVRLGADSRLVIGEHGQRQVWLDGTAFFAVAKQAGAPFVVRTRAGSATVLGTRFEMKTDRDRLRVVVVEGRVDVRNDAGRVEVAGGEMTFTDGVSAPSVSRVADPDRLFAWIGRVLLFNDTRLDLAAREIGHRYPVTVALGDSALAGHLISGTFPEQPIDQLMTTICRVVDAQCSIATDTVWINRKQ